MTFKEIDVSVPDHDCDVNLVLSNGERVVVQFRPSNADVDYNGSLDVILPDNQWVANWEGDDMLPAKISDRDLCSAFAKQLVMEIPPTKQRPH